MGQKRRNNPTGVGDGQGQGHVPGPGQVQDDGRGHDQRRGGGRGPGQEQGGGRGREQGRGGGPGRGQVRGGGLEWGRGRGGSSGPGPNQSGGRGPGQEQGGGRGPGQEQGGGRGPGQEQGGGHGPGQEQGGGRGREQGRGGGRGRGQGRGDGPERGRGGGGSPGPGPNQSGGRGPGQEQGRGGGRGRGQGRGGGPERGRGGGGSPGPRPNQGGGRGPHQEQGGSRGQEQGPGGAPAWGPKQGGGPAWGPKQGGGPAWGTNQGAGRSPDQEQGGDGPREIATPLTAVEVPDKAFSEMSLSTPPTPSKPSISASVFSELIEKIPCRKNPLKAGTEGRPITVMANMMEIKFQRNFCTEVLHYDIAIDPDKPKYLQRPVFEATRLKHFPKRFPAFDGRKNIFSAFKLPISFPFSDKITVINEDGSEREFTVSIQFVNQIDLSWIKNAKPGIRESERERISFQALDVILQSAAVINRTPVGRSYFSAPRGNVMSLGGGMDLWVGIFQSSVLGWKPYLNVDVAHKGFPKPQPVIELIKTICAENNQRGFGRNDQPPPPAEVRAADIINNRDAILAFLKGLKVVTEVPGQPSTRRTYRVNGLMRDAKTSTFEHDGRTISVYDYYNLAKKYQIRHHDYPLLWVGPRDKMIYVPLEICRIVEGQATQKKMNENQTSSMIRYAATGTVERQRKIMQAFDSIKYNDNPTVQEFGVSISGEFERVPARVLDPPALSYNNSNPRDVVRVSRGVWRNTTFLRSSPELGGDSRWTIINLNSRTRDGELQELKTRLMNGGRSLGMPMGPPLMPFSTLRAPLNIKDVRTLMECFDNLKQVKQLKLVIVIIPDMKGPYSKVKQISELQVGILTQCLKGRTLGRLTDATVGNILLKINAKLNGVNHKLADMERPLCLKRPCMIIGADVTHPTPDARDIPSIAAVAASHDPNAFQYNIEIRLQPPREEMILNLDEIVITQLKYFEAKTTYRPERIIYYRDGVSEGEFPKVLHYDLTAIRKACTKLNPEYQPQITFLVVQKRHHIRFFPTDKRNSDDRGFNVQAGTVVDTQITHPSHLDFYLVSHASIQGTARPTKYRCLWDDSNMSEDEIETLTYFLCHMFSRCTRSVSYPTPTYYAHLAAFRARNLTQDVNIDIGNLENEQKKKLTVRSEILKQLPMFFV